VKAYGMDPITLTLDLIACPSVTPNDEGAQSVLTRALETLGFRVHDLVFADEGDPSPVRNLFAVRGSGWPHIMFAGHTDVVPPGDLNQWSNDPFKPQITNGILIGRGANDMKSAIAAFIAAVARLDPDHPGTISLLITGDEEGIAINGTAKVLPWMAARGIRPDFCIVGEPTSSKKLGDMIKIGRRGSLNGILTVTGAQGHVAYPHLADNPIPHLVKLAAALDGLQLDQGTDWFQPSNLEITSIDVGNTATNVIPPKATLRFNIRFNATYQSQDLIALLRQTLDQAADGHSYQLDIQVSGEAFFTEPGHLTDLVSDAIAAVCSNRPELSTTGGTSDARFIRHYCPVVECGLVGASMHKIDEHVPVADIDALSRIYFEILTRA
jgi:succinyl-diaminopimelate desuccinylase